MAKLSNIFETIETVNEVEASKRSYFANELQKNYMLSEGLTSTAYTIEQIETKIISEAIKYKTEKQALNFIYDIEAEFLSEKFLSAIGDAFKGAKDWVVKKVKGAIDAVKNFFSGNKEIKAAFEKFHNTIEPAAIKLKTKGIKSDDTDTKKIEDKKLNSSLILNISKSSFLIESEPAAKGEMKPEDEFDDSTENEDDSQLNAKITKIVGLLASKTKIDTGRKTGSSQKRLRFFKITKSGINVSLWVGKSADDMKILLTYMGASGKVFFNLHSDIVSTQLEMAVVADIIRAMFANKVFNPNGIKTSVQQNGKKLLITPPSNTPVKVFPGKIIIMMVGGKAKMPWKIKKAKKPTEFAKIFTEKFEGDEAHSGVDVSKNEYDENGILLKKDGESDDDYNARLAKDKHLDAKDDNALGDDEDTNAGEAEYLTKFFGVKDLSNAGEVMKKAQNTFNSGKMKPDGMADYFGELLQYFSYLKENGLLDIKLNKINQELPTLTGGSGKIILKGIKAEDLPQAKTTVISAINKFSEKIKPLGLKTAYDEKNWVAFSGIEAAKKTKTDASKQWEDDGKDEVDAFGQTVKKEPKEEGGLTADQQAVSEILKPLTITVLDDDASEKSAYELFGGLEKEIPIKTASDFVSKVELSKEDGTIADIKKAFKGLEGADVANKLIAIASGKETYSKAEKEEQAPVSEENIDSPEKWIKAIINNSGARNVDGTILENLQVDNTSLWKNFSSFAKKNNDSLPNILLATNFGGDYAPMSDNEFLAYSTQLDTILGYVNKATESKKIDTQGYRPAAFREFIVISQAAAATLNKSVNVNTLVPKNKREKQFAKQAGPGTETSPATPEQIDALKAKEAEKKTDPYEAFVKTIETDSPELLKLMNDNLDETSVKVWAKEFTKLGKNVDYENLKSYLKAAPSFFNRKNIKDKVKYINDLTSKAVPANIRIKAFEAIEEMEVGDSFQNIDIFNIDSSEAYTTGNFALTDTAKDKIFLKSTF